jgi:type II secretory ATPase GspE/PulE/Tfp pilus assembly ATPase PilB-like protein
MADLNFLQQMEFTRQAEDISEKPSFLRDKIKKETMLLSKASIVSILNDLISLAFHLGASDIHIDPTEDDVRVRLRIDGVLQDENPIPKLIHSEVISRIKILSGLRTDEHQSAQDGRFRIQLETIRHIDVRVSITPTHNGENAVLRLLVESKEEFTLENLGFSLKDRGIINEALKKPYGMILATGPTGSGKTTTLYSMIKNLSNPGVSIITIEDPIEYGIPGVVQINVNPRTGLTFANGLRSVLRQDPDTIMVGEIRDEETAGLAVNIALTGHLVLSTIHTNDAATTLPRLLDMKIEPYLIASTVNVAIGQRLVRKICPWCKIEQPISHLELQSLSEALPLNVIDERSSFFRGLGCEQCNSTGYKGRVSINEVMAINGPVREAVLKKASASEIKKIAVSQGMTTMLEDGIDKAKQGITTIDEVLRILHE